MSNPRDRLEEVLTLANASLTGQASAEEMKRLEQLVLNDDEACRLYVDAMFDAQQLRRWAVDDPWPTDAFDAESLPLDAAVSVIEPISKNASAEQPSLPVNVFRHTFHSTVGFFSQEVPFSILIATVITSLGLLAGSLIYVTHHTQLVANAPHPSTSPQTAQPDVQYVGRITGMVDCKGSKFRKQGSDKTSHTQWLLTGTEIAKSSILSPKSSIALGDKFVLSAGLLQITYDSGAKVILQGPIVYEVDSPDGGFLAVGKLTARLEKKRSEVRGQGSGEGASGQWPTNVASEANLPSPASGRGAGGEGSRQFANVASGQWSAAGEEGSEFRGQGSDQKSEIRNHKSPISSPQSLIPNPSFAVRTPTAVVTDLGTEFGVEVNKDGMTKSFVFTGKIKVATVPSSSRVQSKEVILVANESVRVEKHNPNDRELFLNLRSAACKPKDFVRVEQMAARMHASQQHPSERFERWQAFRDQLRRRDDLVACYDFQRDADLKRDKNNCEILRNRSKAGSIYDGTLVGAISMGMAQGRMDGKHALRFDFASDGVIINLPTPLHSFTLAAWVNVKNHTQEWNGILLSDAYHDRPGSLHWQFMADGRIELAISGTTREKSMNWRSPPSLLESGKSAGWHHMATVHDAASGKVSHFLDGRPLETEPASTLCKTPTVIGVASIGSWKCRDRAFGGSIDELMIFNRCLSEGDIRHLFQTEAPEDNFVDKNNK